MDSEQTIIEISASLESENATSNDLASSEVDAMDRISGLSLKRSYQGWNRFQSTCSDYCMKRKTVKKKCSRQAAASRAYLPTTSDENISASTLIHN